ncbi:MULTISPECIES: hypothetical protein [Streptomyces]|uniref:hypothetical protein n=1 Tax=Streptomyces TaxID=1883 RepID=UPI00131A375F|nr:MULTISPECIES: hypothetical protein [Streptomyces]MYT07429.1 hypothetical protein [Streptomyces sp. SID5470]
MQLSAGRADSRETENLFGFGLACGAQLNGLVLLDQLHGTHTFEKKVQASSFHAVGNCPKEELGVPDPITPDSEGPIGSEHDGGTFAII